MGVMHSVYLCFRTSLACFQKVLRIILSRLEPSPILDNMSEHRFMVIEQMIEQKNRYTIHDANSYTKKYAKNYANKDIDKG